MICLRPHLAMLPPDLRPEFIAAIVEQAARDPEPFVLDYWRLNIVGAEAGGGRAGGMTDAVTTPDGESARVRYEQGAARCADAAGA